MPLNLFGTVNIGTALALNDFYRRLRFETKTAPCPADELRRWVI